MDIKYTIAHIRRKKDMALTELKKIEDELNKLPSTPYSTLRKIETAIKHVREINIQELERGFNNGPVTTPT